MDDLALGGGLLLASWAGMTALGSWGLGKILPRLKPRNRAILAGGIVAVLFAAILIYRPIRSALLPYQHSQPLPENGLSFPRFPWPPPTPSGSIALYFETVITLGDADRILRGVLADSGYFESSYYSVPDGFALVARLERINEDGSPKQDASRFDTSYRPLEVFSISGYLRALFVAPPGYFRVIAFVFSPRPFAATGAPITAAEASKWILRGVNKLPDELAGRRYTPDIVCTALIYEFEKRDVGSDPIEREPGRLSALTHLTKSGIVRSVTQ